MRVIVLDVDGVLSKGEAHPFDLTLLARLADLNRRAHQGEPVPAVTLNTGRPAPYVEAIMQAIEGWLPALYESGAGLYFPQTYQFQITSCLTSEEIALLNEAIKRVDRLVVQAGRADWQPGKQVCYTLFARPPLTLADLVAEVEAIVSEVSPKLAVIPAVLALNIHPAGIDKGTGLEWLARVIDINPAEMGGIGDSAGDMSFLRRVGYPAAPANATPPIKAVAHYISAYPDTAGVHDILDHWLMR